MSDVDISPEAVERAAKMIEGMPEVDVALLDHQEVEVSALLRALSAALTATQEKLATEEARGRGSEAMVRQLQDACKAAEAGYDRLAERLEITHHWVGKNDGSEMARVEVPRDLWEQQIDGISCRDETIKLQDAALTTAQAQIDADRLARDMALIHYLNDSFNWVREDETTPKTYAEILAAFNTQDKP